MSRYRDLRELSVKLREQLQPLVEDAKSLPEIPELDTELLEAIEQPADRKSNSPARRAAPSPSPERGAAPAGFSMQACQSLRRFAFAMGGGAVA